jgi:hypothetical protein
LFNIATIYDHKLHERALAMEYFRRYLQAPDAESAFVQKATERLSVLKAEADEEERSRRSLPTAAPAPSGAPLRSPSATALPPQAPDDRQARTGWTGWRTTGIVVGATGIAGIGASMILGVLTKNKGAQADQFCEASTCRDPQGVTLDREAANLGTAATTAFVAGAALLVAGVTIYLVAPKSSRAPAASMAIAPQARPSFAGVKLDVSF